MSAGSVSIDEAFRLLGGHVRAGRLDLAMEYCNRILKLVPDHAGTLGILGAIHHDRGAPLLALDCLRRAVAADPGDARLPKLLDACREAGRRQVAALHAGGRRREALEGCCEMLRSSPGDAQTAALLADLLPAILEDAFRAHRAGRFDEAEGLYRALLHASPRNERARALLRILHAQRSRGGPAWAAPDDIPTFIDRASRLLADAGGEDEAGHHPVFARFHLTPTVQGDFADIDFMGVATDPAFDGPYEGAPGGGAMLHASGKAVLPAGARHPPRQSEDYLEWIDLLEAVDAAEGVFVMAELGAGFGRWLVNAAAAIRRRRVGWPDMPVLIGAEAHPTRHEWMLRHFRNNNVDPGRHRLLNVGVAGSHDTFFFPMYRNASVGAPSENKDYGARLYTRDEVRTIFGVTPSGNAHDILITDHRGRSSVLARVPVLPLGEVLGDGGPVDLIDMDIQGAEYEVVAGSLALLNARVKKLHVATHGPSVHDGIRAHLAHAGWICLNDYPGGGVHATPFGEIPFDDGLQTWINPRLRGMPSDGTPA